MGLREALSVEPVSPASQVTDAVGCRFRDLD
jgi:hypothetical protein